MSIIEKALRQAQEPLLKPQPPAVHAPRSSEAPAEAPAPAHSWPTDVPSGSPSAAPAPSTKMLVLVAAAVLVLTAALVIIGAVSLKRALVARRASAPAAGLIPAILPLPAAAPAPSATTQRPATPGATPVLTGVIEGSGAPYAMLNGEIVGLGGSVGGWTLEAIKGSAVTLRQEDGTTTILQVQP